MQPRGMASSWVKHRPWYWAEDRRQPTRAAELRRALAVERAAEHEHDEGSVGGNRRAGSPELAIVRRCVV